MNKSTKKRRIMTTLEIKAQIIHDIDNEQNGAILEKLQKYYRKLKNAEKAKPCQYSVEELKERLARGRKEMENGGGTEHDEFMKEAETWF